VIYESGTFGFKGNGSPAKYGAGTTSLSAHSTKWIGSIWASAALLVGAIIAASPSIKSDADSSNPVVRLLQPSPQRPATPHR